MTGKLDQWIDELGTIGGHGSTVNRFAWTLELHAANEWLLKRLLELGLSAEIDAAGNVIGRWQAGAGPAVLVGSHLDTVPDGGRFDGALGVLSALEAIRRLRAEGVQPQRPLWIAAFNDEEGARFDTSMFGSTAFVGDDLSHLADRVDADGLRLPDAMRQLGSDFTQVATAKGIDQVGCFLELHIEQGARMQDQGLDTAVVTTIVGIKGYRVVLRGQTNHAGTTVMGQRRDALIGASRVILALRDAALASGEVTANVGRVEVRPGGTNVVPGEVEFYIDIRTAKPETYATLDHLVRGTVVAAASLEGLTFELIPTYEHAPIPMDERLQQILGAEMAAHGLRWAPLSSGAGHDAQVLAQHVPTAMLFVPSQDGISHAPAEYTPPEQREPGVSVLTGVLRQLICEPADTAERPDGRRAAADDSIVRFSENDL